MSSPREGPETAPRDDPQQAHTQRAQTEGVGRGRLERVRRDRRLQGAVVVIALVAGLIAGSLGSPRDHNARALSNPSPTTVASGTGTVPHRTVLIAHVDAKHHVDLIAVAGVNSGGRVGSVVFVPTTTLVEVPSFDTQALVDVFRLGGSSLLTTTMSNALGLHFNHVMVVNNARLTALLAPADHLRVTFVRSVEVDDAAGTLAFSPGPATISAADATRLLIGPATGGSLEHLVAVQAVLEGWFARLRVAPVAHATEQVTAAASSLVAVAHADVGFDTIPVDVLSSGSVTGYELQQPDADALVRADFPDGLIVKRKRARVELLNGTGAVALTQAVARQIVPAGGEITLTGNVPGFGVRHTSVVYYRSGDLAAARRLVTALGVGSVAQGNVPIDVVDLTVVIGADFHPTRS
jgi:LytR cell envelope-related transcriptional attenuator